MSKELTEVIVETGILYRLGEQDLYYPELGMSEGSHYNIGKYRIMQWEYLRANRREKYIRLQLDSKLNEHLHEIEEECHARVQILVGQMKAGAAGITEELKAAEQMKCLDV